jgi:threonine/homoserine/homoserine lactone efflux protein
MLEAIWKGILLGLPLIISVGPVIFTIVKQSVNHGRDAGFSFVAGVWVSDIMWVILANGFLELIQQLSTQYKTPIGVGGSMLLLGMGLYNIFFKKVHVKEDQEKIKISSATHARLFSAGFFLNTLNPAVIAFWALTAPAFASTLTVNQRIIMFTTCLGLNILADILKVTLAGKLRNKLNDKNVLKINKFSGILLILFGVVLFFGIILSAHKK